MRASTQPLLPPRGLRGRARQRRLHRLLGHRRLRPGAGEVPAPGFGEFSSKFASSTKAAPWLAEPSVVKADPGTHPLPVAEAGVDVYALTHNETSTGVAMPIKRRRPAPTRARWCWWTRPPARAACRSTSPRPTSTTSRRRSASPPTAACGSRVFSPAALARAAEIAGSGRYIPPFFDLPTAIDNSSKDQTYNTPALATLFLLAEQLEWLNGNGGLDWSVARTADSSSRLYAWAEKSAYATPFVADPAERSQVIGTIDFDDVDRRRRGRQGAARQRNRGHRALPQARPQPAAGGDVPGDRPGRRRGAHRLHRLRHRAALTRLKVHRTKAWGPTGTPVGPHSGSLPQCAMALITTASSSSTSAPLTIRVRVFGSTVSSPAGRGPRRPGRPRRRRRRRSATSCCAGGPGASRSRW